MLTSLLILTAAAVQAPSREAPLLVTTEWLATNLATPKLVIFHIGDQRTRSTYDSGHIPGAQFLNPFTDLSAPPSDSGLRLELPTAEHFDSVLEARGVSDDSRIILVMSNEYYTPTSRSLFALEYAGLRGRVSILDGGLEAWKAEGRAVTADVPVVTRGSFTPRLRRELVVDADWLKTRIETPGLALIDARDTTFFRGAETRQGRNGRIPGATNVPFYSVVAGGKFKDTASLREMLVAAGAAPDRTVVTYCHIGQQASFVWLAARLAGFDPKLYDGSFQEWARRRELPVISP